MMREIKIKWFCSLIIVMFLFVSVQLIEAKATMSYSNNSENGTVVINTNMDNYTDRMKIVSSGGNIISFVRDEDGINRHIDLAAGGLIETYSTPSMLPLSIGLIFVSEDGDFYQDFRIENLDNSDAPYMKGEQILTSRTGSYRIVSYLRDNEKGSLAGTEIEGMVKGRLEQEYEAWSKKLTRFEQSSRVRFEEGFISNSSFRAEGTGNSYFLRTGQNVDMLNQMELNDTIYEIEFVGADAYIEGNSSW